jgi:hypothetical protein
LLAGRHCVGMSNKGHTGWRDRPIVRINTGLSIATIPSFIGRSDRLNRTISKNLQGDCVRGLLAARHALMLSGVRREDHCEVLYRGMPTINVRRMARILSRHS